MKRKIIYVSLVATIVAAKYELGAQVVRCSDCKTIEDKTDVWYNIHDYCYARK